MLGYGTFAPIGIFTHDIQDSTSHFFVLSFLFLHNKLPSTEWLKTTQNYYLIVSVARESDLVSLPWIFHEGFLFSN